MHKRSLNYPLPECGESGTTTDQWHLVTCDKCWDEWAAAEAMMLEALHECLGFFEHKAREGNPMPRYLDKIRAAIAKAEGKVAMRLAPITSAKVQPFRFSCHRCGKSTDTDRDDGARADLDGPAFRAYYCGPCVAVLTREKGDA